MILTAAVVAGCHKSEDKPAPPTSAPTTRPLPPGTVDAGTAADYPHSGVYDRFRSEGFFVIRRAQEIFAMSSICTHRHCKVRVEEDHSFNCHCHHSRYDPDGHVTKGPAKRDLPRLPVAWDERGHLLVIAPRDS
jgi:Rieske Fe-S protein